MTIEARLLSVNIGRPQIVMRNGQAVSTAIYKKAVTERVVLRTLNLDGDRQADLSVHGGPTKAVYFYPSEHYDLASGVPEMICAGISRKLYHVGLSERKRIWRKV